MNIKYKILDNKSQVYRYVVNLKDTVKVGIYFDNNTIDNFDVIDKIGLTDDFQLIKNVEIIIKEVEEKINSLSYNQALLVYIEDYNDKYLFIHKK